MANNNKNDQCHYKLTYFDWPGLAEITRMLFALAKIEYEDIRIPFDDYFPTLSPEWKSKFPWGQVPTLEIIQPGVKPIILAQSVAINRFLGNRFNLVGNNDFEAAKCDELMDAFKDYYIDFQNYVGERDKGKKAQMMANILQVTTPKYLGKFNELIKQNPNGYLVGSTLTWVDVTVCEFLSYMELLFKIKLIDENKYSGLNALREKLYAIPEIQDWRCKRPKINQIGLEKMQSLIGEEHLQM